MRKYSGSADDCKWCVSVRKLRPTVSVQVQHQCALVKHMCVQVLSQCAQVRVSAVSSIK